jgi:hypothetical protein
MQKFFERREYKLPLIAAYMRAYGNIKDGKCDYRQRFLFFSLNKHHHFCLDQSPFSLNIKHVNWDIEEIVGMCEREARLILFNAGDRRGGTWRALTQTHVNLLQLPRLELASTPR